MYVCMYVCYVCMNCIALFLYDNRQIIHIMHIYHISIGPVLRRYQGVSHQRYQKYPIGQPHTSYRQDVWI